MTGFNHYLKDIAIGSSTAHYYTKIVNELLKWFADKQIVPVKVTTWEMISYISHLKSVGKSGTNLQRRLVAINHFFYYQIEAGKRKDNPVQHIRIRGVQNKRIYPVMNMVEVEQIYHSYNIPLSNEHEHLIMRLRRYCKIRNKAMLGLVIWQGLKTWEISHIKLLDVNLTDGRILIGASSIGEQRILSLQPFQVAELEIYISKVRPKLVSHRAESESFNCTNLFITAPSVNNKMTGASSIIYV